MALYCIGDIQGCDAPLARLLAELDFTPSRDTLYAVSYTHLTLPTTPYV